MVTVQASPFEPSGVSGIVLRDPRADDQGYITSTWLKSMRHASRYNAMPSPRYFRIVGGQIDALLDRSDTRCLVAAFDDDLDRIAGWLVYTPVAGAPVLHYLYVRKSRDSNQRRRGIGTRLLRRVGFAPGHVCFYTFHGPQLVILQHMLDRAAPMDIERFLR